MRDPSAGAPPALFERAGELRALAVAARDAADGDGHVVLVEGAAGLGKTTLLAAARGSAREAGLVTLSARGTELEREFGFGVVRQLLEPAVHRPGGPPPAAFAGAARLAAPLLDVELPGAPTPLAAGPEAAFAALHGLGRLVANLARDVPLALLVDDVHWADPPSRRFLAFLAGRAETLPVLLLATSRPAEADPLLPEGMPALVLRPRPLSAGAAAELIRAALPGADDDVCRACHARTGGNPFYLQELAAALAQARRPEDVLAGAPETVAAAVGLRIDRLPEAARRLARAVVILGDGAPLRNAAAVAGLDLDVAGAAADALAGAGVLAPGRPLGFLHPLLRAAVEAGLPAGERATAHAGAARLVAREEGSAERVAAHLLLAEPRGSSWVCEWLARAAAEALGRGAPDAAIAYGRRALLEPPPAGARADVLLDLGHAETLGLQVEAALEHLRRGMETTTRSRRRLEAALELGGLLGTGGHGDVALPVLVSALEQSADADPELIGRVEGHLVCVARLRIDTHAGAAPWRRRVRDRVAAGDDVSGAELAAMTAVMAMEGEPAAGVVAMVERALARAPAIPAVPGDYGATYAVHSLVVADRLDAARRTLDEIIDAAEEHGARWYATAPRVFRSEVHLRRGDLAAALADARAGLAAFGGVWQIGVPAAVSAIVHALVETGDLDEAQAALEDAGLIAPARELSPHYTDTVLLLARGRLRVARGSLAAGLEDLLECGRREEAIGERNPAMLNWRSRAASALARAGDVERARTLAGEELEQARRFGAPRALGIALRAVGALETGERRLAPLREAVAVLETSPARLEHAHALADLGAALRRADGRSGEAREALSAAHELGLACGARPLATRVEQELRSMGARPRRFRTRRPGALTPAERRVAELAARGLTNREIADELVVSVRTVEFHLAGTFRKLGIDSRRGLAAALEARSAR